MSAFDKKHTEQIRAKVKTTDGLGEFWRGMMLAALDAVDAQRKQTDSYGVALMMISEGCAEPQRVASEALEKGKLRNKAHGAEIAKTGKFIAALESIASNTCCNKCQEAALVARAALSSNK